MSEPSLAQLAGHDPDAQVRLAALLERYRREGLPGLRAAVVQLVDESLIDPDAAPIGTYRLIVEAVLSLSEARSPRITREAWAREEERAEIEREQQGGGA